MDLFQNLDFQTFISISYYLIAISTVIFVILDNRPPLKTLSWILLLLLLPILGLILYFYLGHNFKKEKLFEGKKRVDYRRISEITKKQSLDLNQHENDLGEAWSKNRLIKLILRNSKSRLSRFNKLNILQDGSDTYNEIKAALSKAKNHIHLEYYMVEDGQIAEEIASILIQKCAEGVKVKFIYDAVGSWSLSNKYINSLKDEGVEILPFMPVRLPRYASRINYRNHRKIVVVDGKIGFLGGINISDKYLNKSKPESDYWRDTHLKIEGAAVNDLQLIFLTDWNFITDKELIVQDDFFPPNKTKEAGITQILASGPDTEYQGIMNAYFAAISGAEKCVHIVTPYFIPNEPIVQALSTIAASGIEVNLLLPAKGDSKFVQFSSQSYFDILLEAGVQIHLYQKGFIHSKVLLVDDILVSVGTANMDFRSFEQNMEVNAIIYDRGIYQNLYARFQNDLQDSVLIDLERWKKRGGFIKAKESFCRLFGPLF